MRIKKDQPVQSKEVVFEPGNATRYHLVLTKIDQHTLIVTDINEKKAVILDPEFPDMNSYIYSLNKNGGYNSSDAFAIASFIIQALTELYCITYSTVDIFDEVEMNYYWCKDPHSLDEAYEHIATQNGTILDRGFIWQ